ncbi:MULTISPECIES: methylmalonyl-CoA epimerase [Selenomonas]|jgi:methylmalonyl-CoA/ethylmalonyl-CoA epimerase|uniref:Methylmalonyl-CoA epimerase n=1 Tax=Selenomonas ruminantium TaxID=971 RepID=A0A1K1MMX5_SELRU|nr:MULTISPECIES: methylmalonyl-CoA epimerase [Selenomonas]SDZ74311.1 methylmalonyl-CoA epimerase [Selenomonas ruminantium]SFW23278.1 methylmalonyl-CoA epimerase [Selenomonas ruminantium]
MFKVLGVDHIGIAVGDLKEVGSFWGDMLGLPNNGEETVEEQKVTTGFFPTPNGSEIELLAATSDDSPIAKFIEKNGGRGGIQHIALRVDNLEAALADLKEKGVRLIDEKPRKGAGGAKIAFVHPKASHGVLLELCQRD